MSTYNKSLEKLRALYAILTEIRGDDAALIEHEVINPLEASFTHMYIEEEQGITAFSNRTSELLNSIKLPSHES